MGILKFKDFHNIEIDELSSIIIDSLKEFEIYSFTEVQNIDISLYDRNWEQTCQIKNSLNDIIKPRLKLLGYYPLFSYGGSCGHSGIHDSISISINKLTKRIEEE